MDEILEFARQHKEPHKVFKEYQWFRNQLHQGKSLITKGNDYISYMQRKHDTAFHQVKGLYQ